MRTPTCLLLTALLLPAALPGQTQIHVPDDMPAVGTCNSFPYGNATFTYNARIPASFMDPVMTLVDDISFAPCGTNTFSAPEYKMAMGHVPNPLPVPFTNPVIAGGTVVSLGSYLDLAVIHDSDTHGPFSWPYTANVWSPMGYGATGGTGFTWNGIDDVGFFVTHQSATGTSSMHRTTTEPFRVYTSGVYQSPSSGSSGANGLKMRLDLRVGVTPVPSLTLVGAGCAGSSGLPMTLGSAQLPSLGNFSFALDVADGPSASIAYLFISLGVAGAPTPLGGGCSIYLEPSSLTSLIVSGISPIGPVPMSPGGATSFPLPVPADPAAAGFNISFQAAAADSTPLGFVLSNAVDCVIN